MRGTEDFVYEIALSMPQAESVEVWTLPPETSRLIDLGGFAILRCRDCKATHTMHYTLSKGWVLEENSD